MGVHKIICGKSEIELKQFDDDSVDSCVCDPPYNLTSISKRFQHSNPENEHYAMNANHSYGRLLRGSVGGFMGEEWDGTGISFKVELWQEVYRVVKPGAHILVFGGDRTEHRMKCAVEDAGFEIRGTIVWIYGSGFPKSLDISKSLDKMNGEEREVIGIDKRGCSPNYKCTSEDSKNIEITLPTTEEAIQWDGWGTGLKPAVELICMARKPISERNIAANALKWGVGGLNIGKCRIEHNELIKETNRDSRGASWNNDNCGFRNEQNNLASASPQGRFPANLILECCCEDDELVGGKAENNARIRKDIQDKQYKVSAYGKKGTGNGWGIINDNEKCVIHTNPNCVCRMLDEQSGQSKSVCIEGGANRRAYREYEITNPSGWKEVNRQRKTEGFNDTGGCSRFYYQAKASQNERWFYCTICKKAYPMKERDKHTHGAPEETKYKYLEFHPTQKPESLLCYLMRLITPPNDTTIDPFLGSGTAIIAAEREGFNCVGIDSKPEYCEMGYVRGKSELVQQKISGERSMIERMGF